MPTPAPCFRRRHGVTDERLLPGRRIFSAHRRQPIMMTTSVFYHSPRRAPACTAFTRGLRALTLAGFVLACLVLATSPKSACAAAPLCLSEVITVLLPQPEHSQTDAVYAPLRSAWAHFTGASLVFSHRPGRGGSYAVRDAIDAGGGGCTLSAVQMPSLFLLTASADRMFLRDDVAPVAVFASLPVAVWVAEDAPFQTVSDLVAHMRAVIKRGDDVASVAGVGSYSDQHLAFLQFARAAGVTGRYLPVLGSGEAAREVREGTAVACIAYALPPESMPGMKALVVAGAKRSPVLPDVPTMRESSILMESATVFGLALPASASEEKRADYKAALAALTKDVVLAQSLSAIGADPVSMSPTELAAALVIWEEQARNALDDYNLIPRNRRR